MAIGEVDKKILRELAKDANRTDKVIAGVTQVSQSVFTKHKQKLVAEGIIKKFTVDIDFHELGYMSQAFFVCKVTDRKQRDQFMDDMRKIKEIIKINNISGENVDFILQIRCTDNRRLDKIIIEIGDNEALDATKSYSLIIMDSKENFDGLLE